MSTAYDILQHGAMVGDERRLGAYLAAIRRTVRPGDVVVDLGSGTGVFAVAACRAGARRVYAVEAGGIAQVGRDVVAANDCTSRVEFFEDISSNVTLPERADVVVLDVRGVLPDDQIPVALDALRRLVSGDGRLIPARDTIWAAPVSAPELYERHVSVSGYAAEGVDSLPLRQFAARHWYRSRVPADALLTAPECLLTIDYRALDTAEVSSSVEWIVPRSQTAHGFVAWFDSMLCGDVAISNHPSAPPLLYGQGYFPWPEPIVLVEGQTVRLDWSGRPMANGYGWSWATSVFQPGHTDTPILRLGFPARAKSVRSTDPSPVLTAGGRIDREILDLIAAGGLSVGGIAREIQSRNPAQFPRFADALTCVGRVSSLYG